MFYLLIKLLFRISPQYYLKAEYALRFGLVMLTFALAAAIPKLDLFISLVGAVSRYRTEIEEAKNTTNIFSSTLAMMAPAVIDTVTQGERCSW